MLRSSIALLFIALAAALAAACGATDASVGNSNGTSGGTSGNVTPVAPDGVAGALPCAVDAILVSKCGECHGSTPKFGAPMSMVTAADLHAPSKSNPARRVYELVPERISSDQRPMPQPPNARLSAADNATLTSWANSGAPAGTVKCTNEELDGGGPKTACKPDLPIGPASDYEMPVGKGDEYVCYGVELTRSTPTHVVGFSPRIDNSSIVHHVVLFEAETEVSSTPTPCSSGGSLQWRMVTGWAPGNKGFELPPEAGFPLKTTGATHYVVQMHYSNPQALANQKDHSGFDLCTSPPRKYEADVMAFGTQKIDIPVGATVDANCSVKVTSQFAGIHLISVMPHMHKIGTSMSTQLFAGGVGGAASDLGTIANYSFNNQPWLTIGAPGSGGTVTKVNDVIKTHCQWKNTPGQPVSYGQNTADEMCYSFTTYYPKITDTPFGAWSWAAPATLPSCQ